MDGSSQVPSLSLVMAEGQNWAPAKRRRSRKPQETFRRQNTEADDVMSDLIEYEQAENLQMAVNSAGSTGRAPALIFGQEANVNQRHLYNRAVEVWHNHRDLEPAYENCCDDASLNADSLSILRQFGNFGCNEQHYRGSRQSEDSVDHLNPVNNLSLEEDEQEEAEDEFEDEDFNLYGDTVEQTGGRVSESNSKLLSSSKQSVTCEICERTFKGRSQLASHMKTHRRPLHCETCSIRFTSQGTLLWHQRFVHALQKYNHTCEVCGETMRLKQDLMSHYMTHRLAKGVIRCACGQAFRNTATLKLHEINLCAKQRQDSGGYYQAEKVSTGSMLSADDDATSLLTDKRTFSENLPNSCSLAVDGFSSNERSNDPDGDGCLGDKISSDCGGLMSYSCPFCGQTFHSKGLYTIHTKKHTKPHSCDLCGRGFAKKFTMECHRKTHLGQKDYRCDLCGQAFTLRPQLSKHRAENHEMENGLSCQYCDAKFKHRNLLQRHEAYYCLETPAGKDKDHTSSVGQVDFEKELQCPECDKVFDTEWALEQHVKYHQRRFSCEICGNKYGERFLLQSHLLTHLGVRPYKCTVCGSSFTMKAHCERHCRMHLRVQHFECEACGYMFRYEHDRMMHMSRFCLGAKDEKPDISKMMSVEKPDFAQLGITSKMLGYASPPPGASHSPSQLTAEQNASDFIAQSEDGQLDSSPKEADKKDSAEDELPNIKLPLKCHICGKKLKKKAVLMVHLAREHGIGEEPFKCFICGQGAAFEKAMRLHLESHLPYKLYRCSNCGLRFSNKRSLTSHELHEKCFTSSRRSSESNSVESNGCTEIVFVEEDLSKLPQKSFDSELDQEEISASQVLANIKTDDANTEDETGTGGNFASEDLAKIKIKDEIMDDSYGGVNGNSGSSAEDDDDDDDDTICNSFEHDLSPSEDPELENNSMEQEKNLSDEQEDGEQTAEPALLQSPVSENGRLVCVIKKEKNGAGYKIRKSNEESSELAANEPDDEKRRSRLLNVPVHVKVLRDGFGNERVFVNGELFPLWCDFALRASRTSGVSCRDFKAWCEVCQRFIVGKYKYRVHMQRHSHARPFACDFCNKAFKTTENLRTHMRWHDPSRLIVCSICGAKCVSPSDMKRHMTVHEGIKPYVCSTCGKGFRRKMYLNTHVRTHTGETPFSCDICGRRFRIYSSLHDHQKLHSGYKPFECSVCHKRFAQRANWRTHERRHKGVKNFECEVCQKGFVQNYELQNHRLRCVKQDLPYICLLCGMKFTKEHPLKRHINRHSCGICGKQFVIMKEKVSHQLRCRRRSKSELQLQL